MTTAAVHLWGTRIGAVSLRPSPTRDVVFEYDGRFVDGAVGIEPAPLTMPRRRGLHSFPDISYRTFHGLPGMLVDSLPDRFGTGLLDRWFAEQGRNPEEINIVERLLYMADRGMGALTFEPARNLVEATASTALNVADLGRLANAVLQRDENLHRALLRESDAAAALNLIRVGTSAGGARAKAVVAEDESGDYRPGHVLHSEPCRYWLLKFDGIEANADRDGADPPGMTTVEYIYSRIARNAGIHLPETRLLETEGRRHYMIERFDRMVERRKTRRIHYASWCGIDHAHRDWPGAYGYEQLAMACRRLGLPHEDMAQLFARAVYNIVGVNNDDHTKNFGFLMNRRGEWRLSPAFDLTYACDPSGRWTSRHQTSLNGKTDGHGMADLLAFGTSCDLTARDSKRIIDRVRGAFGEWGALAAEYAVPRTTADTITAMHGRVARSLDA